MIPDYHLHTEFSGDCDTEVKSLVDKAISLGMKEICITDHNDLDFPELPDEVDFNLDIERYIPYLKKIREEFKDKIDIKIGVEQGVMPSTCEKLSSFSDKYKDLDFIICSSHFVDGMDPYYPEFFEKYSEKEGYEKYFETILYNTEHFNDFNVYGHLDYILRYGPTKARNFDPKEYLVIFEQIFKNLIYKGKGVEINTGSLTRGLDFAHPNVELLKLYKEMGGEMITFGSDSHKLDTLGYNFNEESIRLKELGFKYYCTFKNMKPIFHNL